MYYELHATSNLVLIGRKDNSEKNNFQTPVQYTIYRFFFIMVLFFHRLSDLKKNEIGGNGMFLFQVLIFILNA